MKVPTLTGMNFEEFDLAFTAAVRKHNALSGIPLYYLLIPDVVENYDATWNSHELKLKFFANLQGQAFNDNAETFKNILVQYDSTYGTGSNTLYRHTRSKNGHKCYLELKGHFKTETYEETNTSKVYYILQN